MKKFHIFHHRYAHGGRLELCALGMLAALALPPLYIFPLAFLAFGYLLVIHDKAQTARAAFWQGWWFGFGFFIAGLYWISFALLIDVVRFGWLIPFAIFGISGVLALYIGLVTLLLFYTRSKGLLKITLFACIWSLAEIARGYLFTGFPWNLMGYSWAFSDSMLQVTSIIGIWGLSFLSVWGFSTAYHFFAQKRYDTLLIAVALFIVIAGAGFLRVQDAPFVNESDVYVRVVQPNIDQSTKWDNSKIWEHMQTFRALSSLPSKAPITHLIWPESALPFPINGKSIVIDEVLSELVPENGAFISGVMRATVSQQCKASECAIDQLYNSMLVLDDQGKRQFYDKSHLVPFGEYIPFREWLSYPVAKITHGSIDFSEGEGTVSMNLPGIGLFSPLICYEVIFPEAVVDQTNRPKLMINVTNDAWYGYSSGPFQHLVMAKVRSVEQGIPIIRAANTGISAVYDAYGRLIKETQLSKTAVMDSRLPIALETKTTYAELGLEGILLIILAIFCICLFQNRKNRDSMPLS